MTAFSIFLIIIPLIALLLLIINLIFSKHEPYLEKDSPFECGYHSFLGQSRTQFSISFFIFGLLFLLFDLEILLVFPYSVTGFVNEYIGFFIFILFFIILTLGFVFELGKGALSITSRQYENNDISSNIIKKKSYSNNISSVYNNKYIYTITGKRHFSTNSVNYYPAAEEPESPTDETELPIRNPDEAFQDPNNMPRVPSPPAISDVPSLTNDGISTILDDMDEKIEDSVKQFKDRVNESTHDLSDSTKFSNCDSKEEARELRTKIIDDKKSDYAKFEEELKEFLNERENAILTSNSPNTENLLLQQRCYVELLKEDNMSSFEREKRAINEALKTSDWYGFPNSNSDSEEENMVEDRSESINSEDRMDIDDNDREINNDNDYDDNDNDYYYYDDDDDDDDDSNNGNNDNNSNNSNNNNNDDINLDNNENINTGHEYHMFTENFFNIIYKLRDLIEEISNIFDNFPFF